MGALNTQNCPKCFNLNPPDAEDCGRCGATLGSDAAVGFLPEMVIAGNYKLLQRIGEGGMGEVWSAVQTSIDRRVAIKFLHAELMKHPTARRRVLGEGKALGKLGHANVVSIFECFETDNTVALVLEFIEGGSLADRIEADGAKKGAGRFLREQGGHAESLLQIIVFAE
jgi:serine/threonine protein kinase